MSEKRIRVLDAWWIPLLLLLLSALIVWIAPAERTLGNGIKIVYVHAALTWSGIIALILAGLIGLWVVLADGRRQHRWMMRIAWTGFGLYLAGFVTSIMAQEINWGGILWQEPRTQATLNVIAVTIIVLVAGQLITVRRWSALLQFLLIGFLLWATRRSPSELHPENAIGNATSNSFRIVLYALTSLYLLVGAWLTYRWSHHRPPK